MEKVQTPSNSAHSAEVYEVKMGLNLIHGTSMLFMIYLTATSMGQTACRRTSG
jgi:hypothetical protein